MTAPLSKADLRAAADEREQRIRAGAAAVGEWLTDVYDAYVSRQWELYGLSDWETYVAERLPELHKVLADKDERAWAVGLLSRQGMSQRAIASTVGRSVGTVNADLRGRGPRAETEGRPAGTNVNSARSWRRRAVRERCSETEQSQPQMCPPQAETPSFERSWVRGALCTVAFDLMEMAEDVDRLAAADSWTPSKKEIDTLRAQSAGLKQAADILRELLPRDDGDG